MTDPQATDLNDAHCHFFSAGFFTTLGRDPSASICRPRSGGIRLVLPPRSRIDGWRSSTVTA